MIQDREMKSLKLFHFKHISMLQHMFTINSLQRLRKRM